jgi:hypothetical protein
MVLKMDFAIILDINEQEPTDTKIADSIARGAIAS